MRRLTRPVAGADYWLKGWLRTFVGERVFRAVLIDRNPVTRDADPIAIMAAALDQKNSLILFPEGTRNTGEEPLLPFKSGLYHLAKARPDVELVPVWIENLNRVMPKGEFVPIPLLCTVTLGAPIALGTTRPRRRSWIAAARRCSRSPPAAGMTDDRRTAEPRVVHRGRGGADRRLDRGVRRSTADSPAEGPNPTIDNLNSRIKAWWAMVALLGARLRVRKTAA